MSGAQPASDPVAIAFFVGCFLAGAGAIAGAVIGGVADFGVFGEEGPGPKRSGVSRQVTARGRPWAMELPRQGLASDQSRLQPRAVNNQACPWMPTLLVFRRYTCCAGTAILRHRPVQKTSSAARPRNRGADGDEFLVGPNTFTVEPKAAVKLPRQAPRTIINSTKALGGMPPMIRTTSPELAMGWLLIERIRSPVRSPIWAAGLLAITFSIETPLPGLSRSVTPKAPFVVLAACRRIKASSPDPTKELAFRTSHCDLAAPHFFVTEF